MKLATKQRHEVPLTIDRYALQEAWMEVVAYGSFAIIWKYRLINDNRLNPTEISNLSTEISNLSTKRLS